MPVAKSVCPTNLTVAISLLWMHITFWPSSRYFLSTFFLANLLKCVTVLVWKLGRPLSWLRGRGCGCRTLELLQHVKRNEDTLFLYYLYLETSKIIEVEVDAKFDAKTYKAKTKTIL